MYQNARDDEVFDGDGGEFKSAEMAGDELSDGAKEVLRNTGESTAGPPMYQSFFTSITNSLKKWCASETKEEEVNDGDEVSLPWPLWLPSSSSPSLSVREVGIYDYYRPLMRA